MAVEKVTIQQAAGDVLKGTAPEITTDTNSFNSSKINPFLVGEKALKDVQKAGDQYSAQNSGGLLFGSKIIQEPKVKEAAQELPKANRPGALGVISNYFKKVGSRVDEYDAAVDIVSKYLIKEKDLKDIVRSNQRITAILSEAGLV